MKSAEPPFKTAMARPTVVFLALAASLLLTCSTERRIPRAPARRIILISVDTLRSDRLPVYGYGGIETPNLDRFRGDGVLFRRAYAHIPLTLPSHGTIFTGLLPADAGLRDNAGFRLLPDTTIAGILKERGYATGAAVSAYSLRRGTGGDCDPVWRCR